MADNYLITGYRGEAHVTAENDRRIHAAAFGTGRFVLPIGEQFRAEYIGSNKIRIHSGMLMDNGTAADIPIGETVDLSVYNAGQGMKRNDLIVFAYTKNSSTLIESGVFKVVMGTETSGTPSDPTLTQNDLLSGNAVVENMPLWRVTVSGTSIGTPERVAPVKWQNPPMEVGVEYCTAEYWLGKPVYTKLVKYTANSSIGNASSSYGFSVSFSTPNFENLIRYCGTIEGSGRAIPCFYNPEAGGGYIGVNFMNHQGVAVEMNRVTLPANTTFAIQVWYTKTTN